MDVLSLLTQVQSLLDSQHGDSFLKASPRFCITLASLLDHDDVSVQTNALDCLVLISTRLGPARFVQETHLSDLMKVCNEKKDKLKPEVKDKFDSFYKFLSSCEGPQPRTALHITELVQRKEQASEHAKNLSSSFVAKRGTDTMVFSLTSENSKSIKEDSKVLQVRLIKIPQIVSVVTQMAPDSELFAALIISVRSQNDNERSNTISVILDHLPSNIFGEFVHLQKSANTQYLDETDGGSNIYMDANQMKSSWKSVFNPAMLLTQSKVFKEAQLVKVDDNNSEKKTIEKLQEEKKKQKEAAQKEQQQRNKENKISKILLNLSSIKVW